MTKTKGGTMTKAKCRYCKKLTILTPYGRCRKCEDIFRAWTARLHRQEFKDAIDALVDRL